MILVEELTVQGVIKNATNHSQCGKEWLKLKKVPVEVEYVRLPDGSVEPKTVIWNDGRRWQISRVLFSSMSPNEYEGIRYTVIIGSAEKYIY